jgi:hypothetical protein
VRYVHLLELLDGDRQLGIGRGEAAEAGGEGPAGLGASSPVFLGGCAPRGYAPAQPGREAPLPRRLQHHTRWSALFPADGEARMFELTSARPLPRVYRSAATGRFAETPTRPAQLHGPVADRLPRHRTGCWLLRDGRIAAARANRHRLVPARLDGGVISVHCLARGRALHHSGLVVGF